VLDPVGGEKCGGRGGNLGLVGSVSCLNFVKSFETDDLVWRTTQQTGNLAVIVVGGGLFVLLTFALTTELFATNSPSVLYSQAVDKIRASDAVSHHLLLKTLNLSSARRTSTAPTQIHTLAPFLSTSPRQSTITSRQCKTPNIRPRSHVGHLLGPWSRSR
jgi:hypothetical protein